MDGCESPSDDSHHFPKVPKASSKFLGLGMTHRKLFRVIRDPRHRPRSHGGRTKAV
jgi:hypothetical protein